MSFLHYLIVVLTLYWCCSAVNSINCPDVVEYLHLNEESYTKPFSCPRSRSVKHINESQSNNKGPTEGSELLTTTKNPEQIPSFCTSSIPIAFNCTSKGTFPDFSDRTCRSYFLCSSLGDGSYVKTEYTCRNTYFDPDIGGCTAEYVCPCNTITTTSTVTTTAFVSTLPGCTIPSKDFECDSEGRFPNNKDVTCRSYFLCSNLRNGTFIKTTYQCLYSTFNPLIMKCSKSYRCPCEATSPSSTISSTTTSKGTTASTTVSLTTPSSTTSSTASSALTTAAPTATFPTTLNEANSTVSYTTLSFPSTSSVIETTSAISCKIIDSDYKCVTTGRFPDYSDVTCRKYFLCSKLHNGTFIKTSYTCLNSAFSPLILRCSKRYTCPCHIDDTSVATSSTASSEHTTSAPTTTESYTCLSTPYDPAFSCIKSGRFPDYRDVNCRKYFLCSKLNNGTFIKTSYACLNSVFNPSTLKCSRIYKCPCVVITSSDTILPTTLSEGFTLTSLSTTSTSYTCDSTSVGASDFTCSSVGRFPDFADKACIRYFLCSKLHNGTFTKAPYICLDSAFDPSTLKCSLEFECPCRINTTTATTSPDIILTEGFTTLPTTTTTTYTCPTDSQGASEFTCIRTGRFPDFTDISCSKYFLCSKLHNGTFINTPYTCLNSAFNPSTLRCSLSYHCPCKTESSSTTNPSTSDSEVSSNSSTSSPYICHTTIENITETSCTSTGRFPDYSDASCRRYVLCSKSPNGIFIKTPYSCLNSMFDPEAGVCSIKYKCPCNNV